MRAIVLAKDTKWRLAMQADLQKKTRSYLFHVFSFSSAHSHITKYQNRASIGGPVGFRNEGGRSKGRR